MAGGVRIENLTDTVRALEALGVGVDDLKDAFADIAAEGATKAASFAPLGPTGRLRGSLRGNRAKSKAVVTAGRASVPYAGAINYGHRARNIEPSGFMQRADRTLAPYSVRRLEKSIDRLIEEQNL